MLEKLSFITILIVATFIVATIFYKKQKVFLILYGIILLSLFTELIVLFLKVNNINYVNHAYNINMIIHIGLWLYLILCCLKQFNFEYALLLMFFIIAMINISFFETNGLAFTTFIVGSIFYIGYYILKNIELLRYERLTFFSTSRFILISAPLSFFFAFSFLFAFRESEMRTIKIAGRTVYNILQNAGNFIYYSLLILYIIKSRNEKTPAHD